MYKSVLAATCSSVITSLVIISIGISSGLLPEGDRSAEEYMTDNNIVAELKDLALNTRIISIESHLIRQGIDVSSPAVMSYLSDVNKEIEEDAKTLKKFAIANMYGQPLVKNTGENVLKVLDTWNISFSSNDAVLLNRFPSSPYLALNHEGLLWPECAENESPTLVYAKATRNDEQWYEEPEFIEDPELKLWWLKFSDISKFDTRAHDRRVLVLASCAPVVNDNS